MEVRTKVGVSPIETEQILTNCRLAIQSGQLSLGVNTERIEAMWPQEGGERNAVVVASGTAGLELIWSVFASCRTVFVPEMTVPMVSDAPRIIGSNVVKLDVDDHLCMNLELLDKRLSEMSAAELHHVGVCYVLTGGLCHPRAKDLLTHWQQRGVKIVLDMSHAHGVPVDGYALYPFADAAVWSFYATKVLTSGEGGIVWFKNKADSDAAKVIANAGKQRGAGVFGLSPSRNLRLSEIAAAMMYVEIANSPVLYKERRDVAQVYDDTGLPGMHKQIPGLRTTFYKYAVPVHQTRYGKHSADQVEAALRSKGVFCTGRVHGIETNGSRNWSQPRSQFWARNHVCLPIGRGVTLADAEYVVRMWNQVT